MKGNLNESALKKFIKNAFSSEAKASRVPVYLFMICVLLAGVFVELFVGNIYLKRAALGTQTYSYSSNDPYEVFYDNSTTNFANTAVTISEPEETLTGSPDSTAAPQTTVFSVEQSQTSSNAVTYVINKNSKKIHYQSCSYASNMNEENKLVVTLTFEELQSGYLSNGYTFCSRCKG